jgi:hypothetical protein
VVIDTATNQRVAGVVGKGMSDIAVTPDGKRVWTTGIPPSIRSFFFAVDTINYDTVALVPIGGRGGTGGLV